MEAGIEWLLILSLISNLVLIMGPLASRDAVILSAKRQQVLAEEAQDEAERQLEVFEAELAGLHNTNNALTKANDALTAQVQLLQEDSEINSDLLRAWIDLMPVFVRDSTKCCSPVPSHYSPEKECCDRATPTNLGSPCNDFASKVYMDSAVCEAGDQPNHLGPYDLPPSKSDTDHFEQRLNEAIRDPNISVKISITDDPKG